ncbi:hypothetical protein UFOVP1229_149 [uncultured Caudovirales phage]|uniref:Uncharacterized protein n=1 Tax=uncultured Caudovirales phage TaxID=2100421 RepID=A0A6J5RB83_9CAUD|nr:hypothetical protein UFOVP1229_149 [uncultured Caudovirales phage]
MNHIKESHEPRLTREMIQRDPESKAERIRLRQNTQSTVHGEKVASSGFARS